MLPPATDTDYAAALQQCLNRQSDSIARHQLAGGETVWVRRAAPRHAAWRYRLLGGMARLLRLGVLTPVPNLGGADSIATEARRLRQLAAAGVAVPPLLAQQPEALMMGSVGQHNLLHEWRTRCDAATLPLRWQAGLAAIAQVHRQGQYLSQAFARNLMYQPDDGGISFIDFEDDPGRVLPLAVCQARDWLCYLHSGARVMQQAGVASATRRLWLEALAHEPASVRAPVASALRRLRWLRHLQSPHWGSDTLRLAAMAAYAPN